MVLETISYLLLILGSLLIWKLWQMRSVPYNGPAPWPIVGHYAKLLSRGLPMTIADWSLRYGPNYEIHMNGRRWVVIGSLTGVRKVALSQKYIVKVTFPEEVLDKIFHCKGLDGQSMSNMHQTLTPNFIDHVGRMALTEGANLVRYIKDTTVKNDDRVCDLHPSVQDLFARTVVPLALGFDKETTEALLATPYMFQYFRYTPTWLQGTFFRGKTDHYRKQIESYLRIVEKVVAGAVPLSKAYLETGAEPPPDFVSRLLRAHNGEIGDSPLTMDEVRHTAIEMFIGATNSTPDMVCYVIMFLAEHNDVQEKVAAEVRSSPQQTPYLEAMRHALPSFGSLRNVTEDDNIEGMSLRAGDAVLMDYRALHFSTEYWGPNAQAAASRPANAYLPFGLGPKMCPGIQLAMTMIRTVVGSLVRSFRFQTYKGLTFANLKKVFHVAVKPGEPCNVICLARDNAQASDQSSVAAS